MHAPGFDSITCGTGLEHTTHTRCSLEVESRFSPILPLPEALVKDNIDVQTLQIRTYLNQTVVPILLLF